MTQQNLAEARTFLEAHSDTALPLLLNLRAHGPRLGDSASSGNFRGLWQGRQLRAVFCLTRRGTLLTESAASTDCAQQILEACAGESMPICGVQGEWRSSLALWELLKQSRDLALGSCTRELLYRLDLRPEHAQVLPSAGARRLQPEDFAAWEPLNARYLTQEGLSPQGTAAQRRAAFAKTTGAGHWWGHEEQGPLLAMAALDAVYQRLGLVGGVFTAPEARQRGLARAVLSALLSDSVNLHRLHQLLLFVAAKNAAARALYHALGFFQVGEYALLLAKGSVRK